MSATTRTRYHHGDLRAALVTAAIELLAERGAQNFSLAEVSRRLGVAASAPYAHFADRDGLLAAVVTHALELFAEELRPALARPGTPHERLATFARTYVQFAATHEAMFQVLFQLHVDKTRHPQVAAAEEPIEQAFRECLRAVSRERDGVVEESLAAAVEAVIHGHAALLLDRRFGQGRRAVRRAAENAARSTLALVHGWS